MNSTLRQVLNRTGHPLPGHYQAWLETEAARLKQALGHQKVALEMMQHSLRRVEQSASPHERLFKRRDFAALLLDMGHYEEALETLATCEELLQIGTSTIIRHYTLEAQCLVGLGKSTEAEHKRQFIQPLLQSDSPVLPLQ